MLTELQLKEMGSPEWWLIVMSSPMYEAEALLKQYKAALLLQKDVDGDTRFQISAQITRVNTEIHRFSQIQNRARLSHAVRNVCGQDVFERVMEEAARLEHAAREQMGVPQC